MSESLDIDSLQRGWAMPKAYSFDLRERVIEAVEIGASRREAAEDSRVSASSAVRWLQRWSESGRAAPKPRGGSVSPLEKFTTQVLALVAEQPDLTLVETVTELRKRRIRTSRSSLWRFLDRHGITLKKACKLRNGCEQMWPKRADVGSESKASAPIWCGSGGALRGVSG